MEEAGVPVYRQIADLPFQPDVIHGQHYHDSLVAILSLPGVPAVYYCHGGTPVETPPRHPRVFRYLAMSRTLRRRLLVELGLGEDQVEVVLNTVDLRRFSTVRTAPARPARALFYNGFHTSKSPTLAAIRQACEQHGLSLNCAGRGEFGRLSHAPAELPEYDLVFASGKSAIDAMACGCAVIVLGRDSAGPLVTPGNFDALRTVNFSIAANCPPPTVAMVAAELAKYDPVDTGEVTRRTRSECGLDQTIDSLETLYRQVTAEYRHHQVDEARELRAAARALRKLTPYIKMLPEEEPGHPEPRPVPEELLPIAPLLHRLYAATDTASVETG
jgi:hypothetical protein